MEREQQDLILRLCEGPGLPAPISHEEFLDRFGASDGVALGLELLEEAVKQRDRDDVSWALVVGFRFGLTTDYLPWLISLAFADWHVAHEDVASALGKLKSPASVEALLHLGQWVPEYLDFDDTRALASKAVYALSGVDGRAAENALGVLAESDHEAVARRATRFVAERRSETSG